jgi:hypothetical protein
MIRALYLTLTKYSPISYTSSVVGFCTGRRPMIETELVVMFHGHRSLLSFVLGKGVRLLRNSSKMMWLVKAGHLSLLSKQPKLRALGELPARTCSWASPALGYSQNYAFEQLIRIASSEEQLALH